MWWLGVLSLFLILVMSLFLTRLATMALMFTGLSRESARFQARSALTGVGFTTSEAEQVVQHPVRRRIIMLLMMLGNAGVVTVMATLIVTFLQAQGTGQILTKLAATLGGLSLFALVANSSWVERKMSFVISWALRRWTHLDARDYVNLLQLANRYGVTEIKVNEDNWLAGRSLDDLRLTEEGILVLGVYPRRGRYIGVPRGSTVIGVGDVLVVYGSSNRLNALHERPHGAEGDAAHAGAAAAFQQSLADQAGTAENA
jgi:hypothetical protein